MGGSAGENINLKEEGGVVVDSVGDIYIVGSTRSLDFPTKSAFQGTYYKKKDIFITKMNATGTRLIFSTYLNGNENDWASGIAIDPAGNVYVTGYTESSDFPTKSAYQPSLKAMKDGFVTKLASSGTDLIYSTYLGGTEDDLVQDIVVDIMGYAIVTGYTLSPDFPTLNAFQGVRPGKNSWNTDAFITKFNMWGNNLEYSQA